ncbi:DUF2290 domain-containing protein [Gluconobacter frateurii]|uniref:DUF2290 domain-containing protein n=1 Tax=Gluconobacter frateurii TaxID=38308 RepID=UPI001F05D674|nr:DUF2290 domain-containing protein [Gluconobacter frateurii]UMM08002.1 DUF2290 domain-containing protein [Gluconobacter frateurii]
MNRRDIENSIHRSWIFLEKVGLGSSFGQPGALPVNEEFRDLALSPETKYTTLYMNGLQNSHYNILLEDYSYFQYSWEKNEEVRYAYYSNPFISTGHDMEKFRRLSQLLAADMITLEEYYTMLNDVQPEIRVPLIRYENAPGQYVALKHPCSHLHIGFHSENRWPVRRVITASAFTMLIAKQYYPQEWEALDSTLGEGFEETLDGMLIEERQNCRIIGDDYFAELEERSFHFG